MRKNMKLTSLMAIVTVMALLIGTLAFFSDRVTANANATTVGGGGQAAVDIVPVDPGDDPGPSDDTEIPDDPNDPDDGLTGFWMDGNAQIAANYNPGDKFDLSYILKNKGVLDVVTRETFVISTPNKAMSATPEFALCTAPTASIHGGWVANEVLGDRISDTVYMYTVTNDTPMASGTSVAKPYFVVFNENASNDYQGVNCTVSYLVEALQSDGSWATVATAAFNLGGQSVNAVPAL